MRGLDPRIHQSSAKCIFETIDCRVKPGNDELEHTNQIF
jgi:hypothetical protein